VTWMRGRPNPPLDPPFKHVIDEYKHGAQQITCTCGWRGSSATSGIEPSEWQRHLREFRVPDRPKA